MKICSKCNKNKKLEEFNKYKRSKDGKKSICKICQSEQSKLYYNKTSEYQKSRKTDPSVLSPTAARIQEQKLLAKNNQKKCNQCDKIKDISAFHKNPQRFDGINSICAECRNYNLRQKYVKNDNYSEKLKNKSQKYYYDNRKKCIKSSQEYKKTREKNDKLWLIKKRVKRRIYDIMRKENWEKTGEKDQYIGCTYEELKRHLESQFLPGMTWDNNTANGWHLEHIIPMALASNYDEAARLNHYTNLKPLWAKDNIKKGAKFNIENKEIYLKYHELLPGENKDIIDSKNSLKNRIYARRCKIKRVMTTEAKTFLNKTHMQGHANFSIAYGLYYDDELVMIMTFGKPRFTKQYEWEIVRMSSKPYTVVIGGASKLFKHFIKEQNPKSIISYCDLRYSHGNVYNILGMSCVGKTKPNYWYKKGDIVYSRYKCMKSKLPKMIPIFLSKLTETENMMINGFTKVYDLGNLKFVWIKN